MRSGRDAYLNGKPLVTVLTQKARASLGLAAIGACAGLLQCLASSRDRRIPKSIAIGAVGSAIGFSRDLPGRPASLPPAWCKALPGILVRLGTSIGSNVIQSTTH